MTTGSVKPFLLGANDPDNRYFKSVTLYQTIEVLTQGTSALWTGNFWGSHGITYDFLYDLPRAYQHLPNRMNGSDRTNTAQFTGKNWLNACIIWGGFGTTMATLC
jgi:hypothetical protein